MDKYVNSLIRGFKKIFNKKYFAIVSVFIGIISILGFSYGYLSAASGWQLAAQLTVRKLYYSLSTSTITAAANSGTTYYNVQITSLNDINTKYILAYKTSSDVTVKVSSASTNKASGIIGLYTTGTNAQKKKTVRLAVTNNSSTAAVINLSVVGGYTWNSDDAVVIPNGYSMVSGIYNEYQYNYGATFGEEISTLLGCTPTESTPCYYKNNSNNYLSYAGQTWRIIGTYLVDSKPVVKAILDDHISGKVTYANVTSALTTFYNGLSTTSLIDGSASSITKAEYDTIGGVNSYLYTKPDENYWTGTQYYVGTSRGAKNLNSSSTAYVRPVITLKATVVNSATGEVGIKTNPYTIVQGVKLTYANMSYGTSNLPEGYYVASRTYTLDPATSTNSNYSFDSWSVSGTGASLDGTTLTMGTGETILTASWSRIRIVTYNCDGGPGTAPSQAQVPSGSNADISSKPCGYKVTAGTSGTVLYQTGWSKTQGGTATSPITITANTTLYATYDTLFAYGGTYNIIDDGGGDWQIEFKKSGSATLTVYSAFTADIHAVGGGGGGGSTTLSNYSGGGGGGGYTYTLIGQPLTATTYTITVGAGGASAGNTLGAVGGTGGTSSFGSLCSATGGTGGGGSVKWNSGSGGAGGSGGGGGSSVSGSATGKGGSNGTAGTAGTNDPGTGGTGCATNSGCKIKTYGGSETTCTITKDFCEDGGTLRAGGGGGGARSSSPAGGSGGGGAGGRSSSLTGTAGTNYYGGGGGGAGNDGTNTSLARKGGCGVVIMRNHR